MQAKGVDVSDSAQYIKEESTKTQNIKEQNISNVTVAVERPHLKANDNGSITYNAKQLMQNHPTANALELLDEIPLIDSDENGKIRIIGTAKTSITINGHKSQMSLQEITGILSSMPPSHIKTIEIYNAAPPHFGTSGGVINFIIDQKREEKMQANGSAWTSLYQGTKYYNTGGVSINAYQKRWMLTSTFSLGNLKETKKYNLYSNHNVDGLEHYVENRQRRDTRNHAIKTVSDFTYDFSPKRNLTLSYQYRTDNSCYESASPLWIDGELDSQNNGDYRSTKHTHTFMAYYTSYNWNIGGDLVIQDNNDDQYVIGDHTNTNAIESAATQNNKRTTLYIHNTKNFSKGKLSYGANLQWARSENSYSNTWANEDTAKTTSKTNAQEEFSLTAFCGWSIKTKKLTMATNLAVEYFKSTLREESASNTLWDGATFAPNLNLNYKMDNSHILTVAFSVSRNYPTYTYTSGRRAYYNNYFYIANSPKVTSYNTYSTNIKYIIKNKYIIGGFSIIEPNRYLQVLYQDPHKLSAGFQYYNLAMWSRHGLLAVIPQSWTTRFDSRLTTYVTYHHSRGEANGIKFDKSQWSIRTMLTNNFILDRKRTMALQMSATYTSETLVGYAVDEGFLNTSIALTWKPKDTGWNIILKCNDPLDTSHTTRHIQYELQSSKYRIFKDARKLNLTVRYSMKGFKEKKIKEADTSRMGL